MEGGFRVYNVEPLSEKARVGEYSDYSDKTI